MLLETVYVRFFRSFNFDYLRQNHEDAEQFPWDLVGPEQQYYPFVNVALEQAITTVVGANESGKTQLISAIQCLLGDAPVRPKDFCRYSSFFGVRHSLGVPEFGGKFSNLSDVEQAALASAVGLASPGPTSFWFFRLEAGPTVFIRDTSGDFTPYLLEDAKIADLKLPHARRMTAGIELPQNISLKALATGLAPAGLRDRQSWYETYRTLHNNEGSLNVPEQLPGLMSMIPPFSPSSDASEVKKSKLAFDLARDMFIKVAGIAPRAFEELLSTGSDDDGYGDALATHITDVLGEALNFAHWWKQDQDFSLQVRKDGFYLVLTMKDRTGQTYTFDERSGGMKYFLSYFIQYMTYEPLEEGRSEILLMDEPDAFLSTQGQQDLLRIFEGYVARDDGTPNAQLLYVTHSPFLIDKNRPERVRVLQKGSGEEGTRIVRKASVDQYEPLRSAFGSFHAENAFIGNCNLLVEGPADQVLFAGISSAMRRLSYPGTSLNLNDLTLVPVHGASQYKYTLHLTRGRDADRPAVVILLDSDPAGLEARPDLEKGYKGQEIVNPDFIYAIGDLPFESLQVATTAIEEPEDLVPSAVARAAITHFAEEVFSQEDAEKISAALPVKMSVPKGRRLFDVVQKVALEASSDCARPLRMGKVEFAKSISAVLDSLEDDVRIQLFSNFSQLFTVLEDRQMRATREQMASRLHDATKRLVERFKRDHRNKALNSSVTYFLDEIETQLVDASDDSERVRQNVRKIRDGFKLLDDPSAYVVDLPLLKTQLGRLVYGADTDKSRAGR